MEKSLKFVKTHFFTALSFTAIFVFSLVAQTIRDLTREREYFSPGVLAVLILTSSLALIKDSRLENISCRPKVYCWFSESAGVFMRIVFDFFLPISILVYDCIDFNKNNVCRLNYEK